jgi:D-alanyl-D-alanine carboxypeptidase (penicillin-binding protein 5/6)
VAGKWTFGLFAGLCLCAPLHAAGASPAPPSETDDIPFLLLTSMNSGQTLFARQADARMLPASTAKIMTAFVAFEAMASGKLRPETKVTVSEAAARQWSGQGTTLHLRAGERVSVDALMRGITVVSGNDAAAVLAEGAGGSVPRWLGLMNGAARTLGMTGSRFASPNGLPDGGQTYVTPRDLAKLSGALILRHPDLYQRYFGQPSFVWRGETYLNRDPVTGVVAGADGIKTGHTTEAGYNFAGSAQRQGHRLIMVMGGAQSEAIRAAASRALLEWGFTAFQSRPLFSNGATISAARVQGGDARSVPLVAPHAVIASVPRGADAPIALRVVYNGPLVAPIRKGAEVARLEIRVGDMAPGSVPLYAGRQVREAGLIDRVLNGLAGLFS